MKVVSVINFKGGVGKTTVTSNLAAYAAQQGKRVLMIDLDPQTNLTLSFVTGKDWEEKYKDKTLMEFFRPIIKGSSKRIPLSSLVISVKSAGLDMELISSHLELISIDTDLAAGLGGANPSIMAHNFLKVHSYLREGLAELKDRYELILIDCPPSFNTVVKNALAASDLYVVPARMDYLSTLGLDQLDRNVERFVKEYDKLVEDIDDDAFSPISPLMLGVIPTMLTIYGDAPSAANQQYMDQVKLKRYHIFPYLRQNTRVHASAPHDGVPVILEPTVGASDSKVRDELQVLGRSFLEKVGI